MAKGKAELLIAIKQTGKNVLDSIKNGIGKLGNVAKTSAVAVTGMGALAIKAWRGQEEAVSSLNASLVNQGIFTDKLSKEYQKQAAELQKLTLFGDEAIISAQAQIQNMVGQEKVTKELTMSILDFAQANKMDVVQAASLVGKSIGTSTNALARYGIEIDTSGTKSEKMSQVLESLNSKFGGQATAATSGSGKIIQLKNALGDVAELIGKAILPVVTFFTEKLLDLTTNSNNSAAALQNITAGAKVGAQGILLFKNIIMTAVKAISGGLGSIAGALTQLIEGEFSMASETLKEGFGSIGEEVKEIWTQHSIDMDLLDQQFKQSKLDRDKETNKKLLKSQANFLKRQREADAQDKKLQKMSDEERLKMQQGVYSQISTLQNSHNKAFALAGKLAAIANIKINTARGMSNALAAFPPPLSFAMAGAVALAGAAQAAQVAGVKLAEGGIVESQPGGTLATIGEAGQDEAVVPLEEGAPAGGFGGSNITINVNGGLMGDEQSAREFAEAIDKRLFELRQENSSLAFDTDII